VISPLMLWSPHAPCLSTSRGRSRRPDLDRTSLLGPGYAQSSSRPASRTATAHNLAVEACPYADICEQCDNFTTSVEFVPALTSAARRRHRPTRGRPSPRLGHRGLGRAATMGRTVCLVDSIGVSDAGSAVMLRREITWPGLHSSPQGRS